MAKPKHKPFVLEKKLTESALRSRRTKYPNHFKVNPWRQHDKFTSDALANNALKDLESHVEFTDYEFRIIERQIEDTSVLSEE